MKWEEVQAEALAVCQLIFPFRRVSDTVFLYWLVSVGFFVETTGWHDYVFMNV